MSSNIKTFYEGLDIILSDVPIIKDFEKALESKKIVKVNNQHGEYYQYDESITKICINTPWSIKKAENCSFDTDMRGNFQSSGRKIYDKGHTILNSYFTNKCLIKCLYEGSNLRNFVDEPLKFIANVKSKVNNENDKKKIDNVYGVIQNMYSHRAENVITEFNMVILLKLLNYGTPLFNIKDEMSEDSHIMTFCNLFGYHVVVYYENKHCSSENNIYFGNPSEAMKEAKYTIALRLLYAHYTLIY